MRNRHERRKAAATSTKKVVRLNTATFDQFFDGVLHNVRAVFERTGEIRPGFDCLADGESFHIAADWPDPGTKQAAYAALQDYFRHRGVKRYLFVTEAWMGDTPGLSPTDDPGRGECVQVIAVERNGPRRAAVAEIIRHGETATLGPWNVALDQKGRLFELLEGGHSDREPKEQCPRRRILIKAVHDAACELATRYTTVAPDDKEPMPDEPVIMVTERGTKGPYLDNKRPTADEIHSFTGTYLDITDPDELWAAFAINTVCGTRYPGLGRTPAEAKVCAWIGHLPDGTGPVQVVNGSAKAPDDWTFELYPPLKPNPKMLAIRALAIFERVRLTIPNVTLEEVQATIVQSLPYMGGRRQ
jgi:hypothetical protein